MVGQIKYKELNIKANSILSSEEMLVYSKLSDYFICETNSGRKISCKYFVDIYKRRPKYGGFKIKVIDRSLSFGSWKETVMQKYIITKNPNQYNGKEENVIDMNFLITNDDKVLIKEFLDVHFSLKNLIR